MLSVGCGGQSMPIAELLDVADRINRGEQDPFSFNLGDGRARFW